MSEDKLLPCPFCGEKLEPDSTVRGFVHSHDRECILNFLPVTEYWVESWNARATDPLMKEMAEALVGMVELYELTCNPIGDVTRRAERALKKYRERIECVIDNNEVIGEIKTKDCPECWGGGSVIILHPGSFGKTQTCSRCSGSGKVEQK